MLANLISQVTIDLDNVYFEENVPRKIKEKEESLQNTFNKRLTIPMMFTEEESTASYSEPKDEEKVTDDVPSIEDRSYVIVDYIESSFIDGDDKPINVKEHMMKNMQRKGSHIEVVADEPETIYDEGIEEVVFDTSSEAEPIVEETIEFEEPSLEAKAEAYGMPANIEKVLSSTFDFDTTVVAINQTRKKFKNVAAQADMATQAAEESEELLQKISNEYTEMEKQLKEKEKRSLEMEQKIISILTNEQDRLSQQMQEKESLINDANKRKEQNDGKIIDFKSKISSAMEKTSEMDEKLSRQEELLNTLAGFGAGFDDFDFGDEGKTSGRAV